MHLLYSFTLTVLWIRPMLIVDPLSALPVYTNGSIRTISVSMHPNLLSTTIQIQQSPSFTSYHIWLYSYTLLSTNRELTFYLESTMSLECNTSQIFKSIQYSNHCFWLIGRLILLNIATITSSFMFHYLTIVII